MWAFVGLLFFSNFPSLSLYDMLIVTSGSLWNIICSFAFYVHLWGSFFWLKQIWVLFLILIPLCWVIYLMEFPKVSSCYNGLQSFICFWNKWDKISHNKKGCVWTHIFSCTSEMYYIVEYARFHTQTISFLLSNNMDFIPNNFISMICPIKNEDCEKWLFINKHKETNDRRNVSA